MFDIREELKRLPERPGVYIMRDDAEVVIYVGKAINLKNRVRSYFQKAYDDDPKVRGIRYYIGALEYIVTNTEVEALILENNLIKRYMPRFNVLLKDDKTYPFVKYTAKEDFPRLYVTRRFDRDQSKYYGPYASKYAVDQTLEVMRTIWPLRLCEKPIILGANGKPIKPTRPCLNYHIGRCLGPCGGRVAKETYEAVAKEALEFLGGRHAPVLKRLEAEMRGLAEREDFEKAAAIRDKIFAIKSLEDKQTTDVLTTGDCDVFAIARNDEDAVAQVFFMREGKLTGRENFMTESKAGINIDDGELLRGVVSRFYGGTPLIPKEILLDIDVPDIEGLESDISLLRGSAVNVSVPKAGDKRNMCVLARENAVVQLEQYAAQIRREFERTRGAAREVQAALEMDGELERIEAYDISNVQGTDSVGSMVVFEGGRPKRSEYRKFKIKTVRGANDFASMDEVLTRRFTRYISERGESGSKFGALPDLILMDGGKPQISAALLALERLGLFVPVCGMVKDDKHRTRALLFNDEERKMPYTSEGFKLVARIQDEVHRFAIEYHRKLRQQTMTRSVLDDIKGIGSTRREALLKHFRSVDKIRAASAQELREAQGMNKTAAEAVFLYFHGARE